MKVPDDNTQIRRRKVHLADQDAPTGADMKVPIEGWLIVGLLLGAFYLGGTALIDIFS